MFNSLLLLTPLFLDYIRFYLYSFSGFSGFKLFLVFVFYEYFCNFWKGLEIPFVLLKVEIRMINK